MSYKCDICGKSVVSGNKISHSNRHTRTKWRPNLQLIRVLLAGTVRRLKVCTGCIKSGKITKAPRRNYKKGA